MQKKHCLFQAFYDVVIAGTIVFSSPHTLVTYLNE